MKFNVNLKTQFSLCLPALPAAFPYGKHAERRKNLFVLLTIFTKNKHGPAKTKSRRSFDPRPNLRRFETPHCETLRRRRPLPGPGVSFRHEGLKSLHGMFRAAHRKRGQPSFPPSSPAKKAGTGQSYSGLFLPVRSTPARASRPASADLTALPAFSRARDEAESEARRIPDVLQPCRRKE